MAKSRRKKRVEAESEEEEEVEEPESEEEEEAPRKKHARRELDRRKLDARLVHVSPRVGVSAFVPFQGFCKLVMRNICLLLVIVCAASAYMLEAQESRNLFAPSLLQPNSRGYLIFASVLRGE